MLIRDLIFSSFHPLDEEQLRDRSDWKRWSKLSSLRRSIRDPSARPKPCRALRNFDQCSTEEAAQTRQVCATVAETIFPFHYVLIRGFGLLLRSFHAQLYFTEGDEHICRARGAAIRSLLPT